MISSVDLVFIAIIAVMAFVNAKRGFVVALVGMLRFMFIVPVSYFLTDYVTPYIPKETLEQIPNQLQGVVIFAVVFVALIIITGILMNLLIKLQHKKGIPLRHTNAILGGSFGVLKALILISVISGIMALIVDYIPQSSQFFNALNDSYIVGIVKELNLEELKAF